jgi:Sulfatase
MKTYREGERFPGDSGRTWEDSDPAFPMPPSAPEDAPKVLCVVVDDIGFGWIEPFGGEIRTPNIGRLADNGLKYANFMTTALCSPTRAALLTGRNHHSVGMAAITEMATGYPGYNARQHRARPGCRRCSTSTTRLGPFSKGLVRFDTCMIDIRSRSLERAAERATPDGETMR